MATRAQPHILDRVTCCQGIVVSWFRLILMPQHRALTTAVIDRFRHTKSRSNHQKAKWLPALKFLSGT
jgi:hypothetical protein